MILDFHIVVILKLLVFRVVNFLLFVGYFVLNRIDLVQVRFPGFFEGQPFSVRQSYLQFALLLLDLQSLDPFDFGLNVAVDDGALAHGDQEVLDVHLVQLGRSGRGLEVRLEDRDVAQLPPALDLVLLLHLDQPVLQPELQEVLVLQVASFVHDFDHVEANRFLQQPVDVLRLGLGVDVRVVVLLELELHEVAQARVVAELQDDVLLGIFLEPVFISLCEQAFQLADAGYQMFQFQLFVIFFVRTHVSESERRRDFLQQLRCFVKINVQQFGWVELRLLFPKLLLIICIYTPQ